MNLYPDDGKLREIGARDLLDAVVMSEDVETEKCRETAFLRMKNKLISMPPPVSASSSSTTQVTSSFERKILAQEMKENAEENQ